MGRYSIDGKKTEVLDFKFVKQKVINANLPSRDESFFWLLYYCGVRKSEAYERVASDFKVTETSLIVDFHQRKKRGAEVPPLELPLGWYGMDKLVKAVQAAASCKPRSKAVFIYVDKKRVRVLRVDRWVFPHIQSTRAWEIVQSVLGVGFYPHFLRLNRLTELASDPSSNLTRLKSFTGIKSTIVLDSYLGTSKKEQKKAIEYMSQKFS
jgi:site-specific recombinase XerC